MIYLIKGLKDLYRLYIALMRTLLFILLLIVSHCVCRAQANSRIVFFRMNQEFGPHPSLMEELMSPSRNLVHNDSVIATVYGTSAFVFDAKDVAGTYFLAAPSGSNKKKKRLVIGPQAHTVTFVKIELSITRPIISRCEVVDIGVFETYYNSSKVLQKKFNDAGFGSIKELVDGFVIVRDDSAGRVLNSVLHRQFKRTLNDTFFLNKDGFECSKNNAMSYNITRFEKEGSYIVKEYFVSNNQLASEGHFSNIDSPIREGEFIYYSKKGNIVRKGSYKHSNATGVWQHYYDTLNNPIWYTCNYADDHMQGMLTSYYPNGKTKREELHQYLIDSLYRSSWKNNDEPITRSRDTIVSGICYGEDGKKLAFTPFRILPKPNFDIRSFIATNLSYPPYARKDNISGRVIVKFTVRADGEVDDVRVIKSVSNELDAEAIRLVNLFPSWEPGKVDDKIVVSEFNLPMLFKLE